MKYFKIDFQNFYDIGRTPSYAEGEKIPNAEYYFRKIRDGEIINAPIFDYFYLKSFDTKEFWEWKLCDVHGFIGEASWISPCWLVSEDLKLLLETFNLPSPYHFYPSKLLYKRKKQDYYIFQFTGNFIYEQTLEYIDYSKSIFWNPIKKINVNVDDTNSFLLEYKKIYKESGSLDRIIENKRLVFNEHLDFFPIGTFMKDDIVSEKLKTAIEEMGIEGFEFSELNYEVVVDQAQG